MKTMAKGTIMVLMWVVSLCWLSPAMAETGVATGAGSSAAARLDFRINIPTFIVFTVGATGTGNIDTVVFDPAEADIAAGNPNTAATAGSGTVAVSVISNGGQVTLGATNNGGGNGLGDGVGNFISYDQINTAVSSGSITPPTLTDAASVPQNVPLTSAPITVQTGEWIYTYDNPATPPVPGTYTGRVTYTASLP